jgi:urease accessory protein
LHNVAAPQGLHGHLDLLAGTDDGGRTVLRRQSFSAPFHISKPYYDAGWLVVNLASPTPGFLSGDRVEANVEVSEDARLVLTAPSASRLHTMASGHAELVQEFRVARGACVDFFPEYLIPQRRTRYRQRTRISVEPGGMLLWCESIAPGRTASGEVFAFEELQFATDIFIGATHSFRERIRLVPGESALNALKMSFPAAYYASVVCIAPNISPRAEALSSLHDPDVAWVGLGSLPSAGWIVKIVAADSIALRERLSRTREFFYETLGMRMPSIRRINATPDNPRSRS